MPFWGDVLKYAVECRYGNEAFETFLQKIKNDSFNQLDDYGASVCERQYMCMSCYISFFNFKSFHQSKILDIYSFETL